MIKVKECSGHQICRFLARNLKLEGGGHIPPCRNSVNTVTYVLLQSRSLIWGQVSDLLLMLNGTALQFS